MEQQNEMVLAFLLVVMVDGALHDSNGDIYWDSIVTCGEYASYIERTAPTTWETQRLQKQTKIQAWCVPKLVNPKEVRIWK